MASNRIVFRTDGSNYSLCNLAPSRGGLFIFWCSFVFITGLLIVFSVLFLMFFILPSLEQPLLQLAISFLVDELDSASIQINYSVTGLFLLSSGV